MQLENDAQNWMFFKTIGQSLRLRANVVPHKLINTPVEGSVIRSQLSDSAKKRKLINLESLSQSEIKIKRHVFEEESSTSKLTHTIIPYSHSSTSHDIPCFPQRSNANIEIKEKSVTQQSRAVQVKLVSNIRSIGVSTKKTKFISTASSPIQFICTEAKQKDVPDAQDGSSSSSLSSPLKSSSSYHPSPLTDSTSDTTSPRKIKTNSRAASTITLLEIKSRFYLGLPEDTYVYVHHISDQAQVSYRDVLITLKKIRVDDVYERLADDFDMSSSNVQKIFVTTVPKIANFAQELIFWPTSYCIKRTLPIPFRLHYNKVESIIDCLEIEIEKSSDSVVQAITWSEYKKCNTLKFLISATPNGLINYVSGGYGGRTSDKEIVEKCGYLDVLPNGVNILADRGFKHIAALLSQRGVTLIRPPSIIDDEQLSRDQVRLNKQIASLRVHIERVIRRLREFQMLSAHSRVNNNLWYLMNHIMLIACSIVNIQGPLIK